METDIHHKSGLRPLALVGQWPLEIQSYKKLRIAHQVYSVILRWYFVLFVISEYIDITHSLNAGIFELVNNFAVSLLYTITFLKTLSVRSKAMRKLIAQTRNIEKIIMECDDEEIKKIYLYHTRWSIQICWGFVVAAYLTAAFFYVNPIIEAYKNPAIQSGEVSRRLPFNAWLPFDAEQHYWVGFWLHCMAGSVGSITTAGTDSVFWSMTIFGVGQLKILQYKLQNLDQHAQGFADRGQMSKDAAIQHCMKKCIFMHKLIIEFITNLDNNIKNLMFIDFLLCSFQISTVGFQVIMIGDPVEQFSKIFYLVVILVQLYYFYFYANDIILESLSLSTAIWDGKIYEYPQSIQKDLAFLMLRAQKPLALNVGPFYAMSTSTLLSILRAIYSYIAILNQFYNN